MKNVERTLNLLVPIFIGSVVGVTGLLPINMSSQLATLICQRVQPTQGSCQFVHSRLLGSDETTIPLNQLQSAKVDVDVKIVIKRRNSYRIVLLTDGGEVPFTTAFSSGAEEAQEDADRINTFIANSGKISLRVQVRPDDRWFNYIFGGFRIFMGVKFIKLGFELWDNN